MKKIGLHVRLQHQLLEGIEKAVALEMTTFQHFLITQETRRYVSLDEKSVESFLSLRRSHFTDIFIHGSYLINPASGNPYQRRLLIKELAMSERLEFSHYVMHPGSARGCGDKKKGLDNLIKLIDEIHQRFFSIQLVLENTAHGKLSIGSDLDDFFLILDRIKYPDRLKFCLDTAHAFVYGYGIMQGGLHPAIGYIEKLGPARLALLHINDTSQPQGSKVDRHERLGHGIIGLEELRAFVSHPLFYNVPILLESPLMHQEDEIQELNLVRSWV